jgi:hypothetical protein
MIGGAMCMFIVSAEVPAVRWRTRPAAVPGAEGEEDGEPHNSLDRNRLDEQQT